MCPQTDASAEGTELKAWFGFISEMFTLLDRRRYFEDEQQKLFNEIVRVSNASERSDGKLLRYQMETSAARDIGERMETLVRGRLLHQNLNSEVIEQIRTQKNRNLQLLIHIGILKGQARARSSPPPMIEITDSMLFSSDCFQSPVCGVS
jgi:hypothetical protein